MSGITGIIAPARDIVYPASTLAAMVECLVHENFFRTGIWNEASLGLQSGWASHPGLAWEKGPVWNTRHDIAILLIGDDRDLDAKIKSARDSGREFGDPREVLLLRYEQRGTAFLSELNGCFCGLLIDLRSKTVLLFNDRFGLNRIYLHDSQNGVHFSSQAASLLTVLPHLRRFDQQSLAEHYSTGCVLQNRSLFPSITLLPPGSVWTFSAGRLIERGRYFDPETWEQQLPLDVDAYIEQLIEIFGRIAPHYLSAPLATAMSLTGGLDSRMLLSWAKAAPGTLPCYSFSGPFRDCADVLIARQLAHACGQNHSTLRIERDFFENFGALAEKTIRVSDGSMDVSGAVELYVNRKARTIAPIRLTGNYGSEILRSNVAFRPRKIDHSLFTPEFTELLRLAEETYRAEAKTTRLSLIAFKQVPWHHYARYSIERSQIMPSSPFLDNELVALAYRAPCGLATSVHPLLALIAAGNSVLATIPTDRGHQLGRPSLTARLRQRWQDLTAKAEYTFDYGMPQPLARWEGHFAKLHLERMFLGRHKFYHFRIWYKDSLRDFLTAQIAANSYELEPYRTGTPTRLVSEHLSGRANHTLEIHRMLSVQLTRQCLFKL